MKWIDVVARGLKMARHNRSVTSFGFLMSYFGVVAAIAGGREMLAGFVFGALSCAVTAVIAVAGEDSE